MLSIEALIFDLDGTLIDSKKDIALSIHLLQSAYQKPPSSETDIARFIGDGVAKLVERAIGRRSPRELGKAVTMYKTLYRDHAFDHTRLYPGVARTLAHFREKKMAVLTNKPVRISQRLVDGLGLSRFFPVVVGGDSVQRKKPHPEGLFLALERLRVRRLDRVLMVGDSFQDILAGRAAGVHTCGLFSNIGDRLLLQKAHPEYTVRSLIDLMRFVE